MNIQAIREARSTIKKFYIALCLLDYDDKLILTDDTIVIYVGKAEEVLTRTHTYIDIESVAVAVMRLGLEATIDDLVFEASEIMALIS